MNDFIEPMEPIDPDWLDARMIEADALLRERYCWGHSRGYMSTNPPVAFDAEERKAIIVEAAAHCVNPVHAAWVAIKAKQDALLATWCRALN